MYFPFFFIILQSIRKNAAMQNISVSRLRTEIAYRQQHIELPRSVKKVWSPVETLLGSLYLLVYGINQ